MFNLFFILSLLYVNGIWAEVKEEEDVLVLTKNNFQNVLKKHEFVLVEFYAPWCGHCKALAPEYAKAAGTLKKQGSPIRLAKVDATEENELAEEHDVRGYPTLKWFKKGERFDYSGGRKADDIVSWVVKRSGPAARNLTNVDEVKEFVEEGGDVVVLGLFSSDASDSAKHFIAVADTIDESPFGISTDPDVRQEYAADSDKVIVFKKFDEGKAEYDGPWTGVQELRSFVLLESLPLVIEFNHESAQKIFGGAIKSHLLLFLSKKAEHYEKILDPIRPLAKTFKEKLLFVSINVDEPDHNRIMEFFGLKEEEVPTMRLIRLEEDMSKFKPEVNDLSPDNVKSFIQSFVDGKLKEHLLSQDLPADWDEKPVKVLVSTNFDEVVFDKEKDVLVEFYAPWCGHCKQLVPVYEKLAESLKDRTDILIAKIDATANELEHTKITSFPTIKLYKKGTNEVVDFNGARNLEGLTKFVESGGEIGQSPPLEPEEEEEEEEEEKEKEEEKEEKQEEPARDEL